MSSLWEYATVSNSICQHQTDCTCYLPAFPSAPIWSIIEGACAIRQVAQSRACFLEDNEHLTTYGSEVCLPSEQLWEQQFLFQWVSKRVRSQRVGSQLAVARASKITNDWCLAVVQVIRSIPLCCCHCHWRCGWDSQTETTSTQACVCVGVLHSVTGRHRITLMQTDGGLMAMMDAALWR